MTGRPGGPYHIARVIARTNVGGPSLQVTALMRHLDPVMYPQTLYRGSVEVGEADYLELRAPDVIATDVPGLGRSVHMFDDAKSLWFLIRRFRRERPVIVHTHTAKAGVVGRLAAIVSRVPIRVHTFHGHVLHGYFSPRMTKMIVLIERALAHFTTHTVAVGQQVLDDLIAAKIAKPTSSSVVAPGVRRPEKRDRAAARRTLAPHATDESVVVVFVGRLTAIKRGARFVDLARQLLGPCPHALFVVVGDGPERADLESAAAGLDNVVFAGWQADMAGVYASADLIVLTSDNEGMPVALIEGAMQGVPAVATDVGAVRQVVADNETGILVAAGDSEQLAEAVEKLVTNETLRTEMGSAAAERGARLFGEGRLVDDYTKLYDRLTNELRDRRRYPA